MAARTTDLVDDSSEEPASVRVETFLRCVEIKRRRTVRVRIVAAAVGALVASVAFLTSIGVIMPDAARLAASAGTLVAGILAGVEGHDNRASPEHAKR